MPSGTSYSVVDARENVRDSHFTRATSYSIQDRTQSTDESSQRGPTPRTGEDCRLSDVALYHEYNKTDTDLAAVRDSVCTYSRNYKQTQKGAFALSVTHREGPQATSGSAPSRRGLVDARGRKGGGTRPYSYHSYAQTQRECRSTIRILKSGRERWSPTRRVREPSNREA